MQSIASWEKTLAILDCQTLLSEIYITTFLCRILIVFERKFLEPLRYHSKLPKECFFSVISPAKQETKNDPNYFITKAFILLHKNNSTFDPETNILEDYFITV